jgi:hypothetical protein
MSLRRPNWLVMLAVIAVLLPASFASAAIQIIDISFTATNFSPGGAPVDPVTGRFEFQFDDSGIPSRIVDLNLTPTVVEVNYDAFTTANVGGTIAWDPSTSTVENYLIFGEPLGFDIACINGCGDDLLLTSSYIFSGPTFQGSVTGGTVRFLANGEDLVVRIEQRVSDS